MSRREIIMGMRTSGKLKGVKPVYIYLKPSFGKIYNEGNSDYVMSMKNDKFYFQKITFFFHKLKPENDFELSLKRFKEYWLKKTKFYNVLYLYDEAGRYIDIYYNKGIPDTIPTEENFNRILKELDKLGIKNKEKEEDEGNDSGTEESDQEVRSSEKEKE